LTNSRAPRAQSAAAQPDDCAGEAGAEVRGDAGRHPREERGGGGAQGERQHERPRQAPRAAPPAAPAARVAAAELPAAALPGAAHAELGVVRPAVVGAVHVLGRRDHNHGGRDHHLAGRRLPVPDPAVRLGALLKPLLSACRLIDQTVPPFVHGSLVPLFLLWILSISIFSLLFFHFLSICISTIYLQKEQRPTPVRRVCSVS